MHVSIRLTFLAIVRTSFDTCIVWAVPEEKNHYDGSILGFILTMSGDLTYTYLT